MLQRGHPQSFPQQVSQLLEEHSVQFCSHSPARDWRTLVSAGSGVRGQVTESSLIWRNRSRRSLPHRARKILFLKKLLGRLASGAHIL